ncbi:2OG-Fe(II) oxygenase [Anabaena sp. UHCC 0399]|uniref:2OG-Fe(II) oxygenase n=1 Tax=Anabaena sp. UHCC 0399 TaxID=3110238 RepID=UPI002B2128A5|nr:2OG-Fe(II) oxygenase [Anabaena sp. UHCC 0399]MEA5568346.1 2OG-Fe(II) oxygenase [Anabaena sp. UHCC 0399]
MLRLFPRIQNKLLRNFIRFPLIRYHADLAYQTDIKEHLPYLPILSSHDLNIVKAIKTQGIAITSLDELGISSNLQILQLAQKLLPNIKSNIAVQKNGFVVHANAEQMIEYPEIFLWGLEQRLLNIIENYLGLPVAYHGAYFRRDIANQLETGSRLWHIDTEDRQVIKIILYINNVDEETGPFQYLPQPLTTEVAKSLNYTSGYLTDKTMQKVISPKQYQSCVGAAGTVIFAATGSIFHRGKPPSNSDRFAIFFDYTSHRKKYLYYNTSPLTNEFLVKYYNHLSEQQKKYIYWQ